MTNDALKTVHPKIPTAKRPDSGLLKTVAA
jgi:hypothetical protein